MQLSCKTEHIDGIMAMHVQQHLPDQVFRLYYFSGSLVVLVLHGYTCIGKFSYIGDI